MTGPNVWWESIFRWRLRRFHVSSAKDITASIVRASYSLPRDTSSAPVARGRRADEVITKMLARDGAGPIMPATIAPDSDDGTDETEPTLVDAELNRPAPTFEG